MEPDGGGEPVQISIIIYDRMQLHDGSEDMVYAFNPNDRMYTHFVHRPYSETTLNFESNLDYLTWNVVWWKSLFNKNDTIDFVYNNPILLDEDVFSFSTAN